MKTIYRTIAVFCGMAFIVLTCAFYIQSFNFNSNQFTAVAPYLSLKSGVLITNADEQITTGNFWQVMYANNNNAVVITGDGSLKFYDNLGNNYFNYMVGSNAVAINTNLNVTGSVTVTSTNANSYFAGTVFATNGFTAVGGVFTGNGSGLTNLSGVSSLPAGTNSGDMISYHNGSWIAEPMGQRIFLGTSTNGTATNLATFSTGATLVPLTNGYSVDYDGLFLATSAGTGGTNTAVWKKHFLFRNDAGTVSLVYSNQTDTSALTKPSTNYNCQFGISGTNIVCTVVGDSNQPTAWKWEGYGMLMANAITNVAASTNLMTNLIAYWKLDENITSGTRNDSTANAENLTDLNNNVPSSTLHTVIGARDTSWNGSFGPLIHADDANLKLGANQDFTIMFWVYPNNLGSTLAYVVKGDLGGINDEYYVINTSAAHFKFGIANGTSGTSITAATTTSTLTTNQVIATYNGTAQQIHLYINGVEDANSPVAWTGGTHGTTQRFTVGGRSTDNSFLPNCFLQQIGFWKRCLTSSGVTALYNSGSGVDFSLFPTINQ